MTKQYYTKLLTIVYVLTMITTACTTGKYVQPQPYMYSDVCMYSPICQHNGRRMHISKIGDDTCDCKYGLLHEYRTKKLTTK